MSTAHLLRALAPSEWQNQRSTPTLWSLLAASVVMAIIMLVANVSILDVGELSAESTLGLAMHASTVTTLTFALVTGVVSATSDYRFGRIDQLLLTQPNATGVFGSKALIALGVGTLYGIAGGITALATVATYYQVRGVPLEVFQEATIRPVLGAVVGAAFFGTLGSAIGTVVRNQPLAVIGSLVFLLIIQPPLLLGLPELGKWLPGAAGLAITLAPDPELVGQLTGGAVLAAWTALGVGLATWRLQTLRAARSD